MAVEWKPTRPSLSPRSGFRLFRRPASASRTPTFALVAAHGRLVMGLVCQLEHALADTDFFAGNAFGSEPIRDCERGARPHIERSFPSWGPTAK